MKFPRTWSTWEWRCLCCRNIGLISSSGHLDPSKRSFLCLDCGSLNGGSISLQGTVAPPGTLIVSKTDEVEV